MYTSYRMEKQGHKCTGAAFNLQVGGSGTPDTMKNILGERKADYFGTIRPKFGGDCVRKFVN